MSRGLTIRSSRDRFAVRLNSSVMQAGRVALNSYIRFLKARILVGIPFFFLIGAMGVWLVIDGAPSKAAVVISSK